MEIGIVGPGGTRDLLINQPEGYGTGGFYVDTGEKTYYIDPGPGALYKINKFGWKLDINCLIVSHHHLDHYGDILAMIEYSSRLERKVDLITTEDVWNHIDRYHREFVNYINYRSLNNIFQIQHGIDGFGIRIEGESYLYYTSDGKYHEGILRQVSDTMIANITIDNMISDKHMSIQDLYKFLDVIQPHTLILYHFSKHILNRLDEIRDNIEDKYKIEVYIAREKDKYVL